MKKIAIMFVIIVLVAIAGISEAHAQKPDFDTIRHHDKEQGEDPCKTDGTDCGKPDKPGQGDERGKGRPKCIENETGATHGEVDLCPKDEPTPEPTEEPTVEPTPEVTPVPTEEPTEEPTVEPTPTSTPDPEDPQDPSDPEDPEDPGQPEIRNSDSPEPEILAQVAEELCEDCGPAVCLLGVGKVVLTSNGRYLAISQESEPVWFKTQLAAEQAGFTYVGEECSVCAAGWAVQEVTETTVTVYFGPGSTPWDAGAAIARQLGEDEIFVSPELVELGKKLSRAWHRNGMPIDGAFYTVSR